MKNECGKTRKIDDPYEIWEIPGTEWCWKVLKKYQNPEQEAKNEFAVWFCAVRGSGTFGSFEYGDTYVKDIKEHAIRIK